MIACSQCNTAYTRPGFYCQDVFAREDGWMQDVNGRWWCAVCGPPPPPTPEETRRLIEELYGPHDSYRQARERVNTWYDCITGQLSKKLAKRDGRSTGGMP